MANQKPLKILVSGDVRGKISQLYGRVKNILKKSGEFELLLCVGSFFGNGEDGEKDWEQYQNGTLKAPIVTYILGPNEGVEVPFYGQKSLEDGTELCENVTYLGRRGLLSTPSGLQIAYLSGLDSLLSTTECCTFSKDDIDALESKSTEEKFIGIDILVTSSWPQGMSQYASTPAGVNSDNWSVLVSRLATKLRPRYHFAGLEGVHYERLPYRNHQVLKEPARHVTRFISLANVGNPDKKKYLYAFNIAPLCFMDKEELVKQPPDVTECPYGKILHSMQNTSTKTQPKEQAANFFFDMSQSAPGQKRKRQEGYQPRQHKGPPPTKGPCWFCLGSPQVEKHLVISVANESYVALAKGGLVPDHVLICPIAHFESTVKLPENVLMEIEKYKQALRRLYHKDDWACVIFERNFYTQHLQLQVVPIPQIEVNELKEVFREHAELQSMQFTDIPTNTDLKQIVPVGAPYFVVEFDNGDRMVHRVRGKMPLQFGREVLASSAILDMPDRVDWKNCKVSADEEKKIATDFRKKFQPFDFNFT